MAALMIMVFLCFVGMLIMFLFVIRSNTILSENIKEATRQQRELFNDIERHIMELSFTVNKAEVKEVCGQYAEFSQLADSMDINAAPKIQQEAVHGAKGASGSPLPELSLQQNTPSFKHPR